MGGGGGIKGEAIHLFSLSLVKMFAKLKGLSDAKAG